MGCIGTQMIGDPVMDAMYNYVPVAWTMDLRWSGSHQKPYVIVGLCVDNVGLPVAGATVELWLSTGEVFMESQLSGPGGQYAFWVMDSTTPYFVVAFKTAPQSAGITVRNLVGVAM